MEKLILLVCAVWISFPGGVSHATEQTTSTNVLGWHLSLSSVSTQYAFGSSVVVSLVISNTASRLRDFGFYTEIAGSCPTLPNFGRPRVWRLTNGTNSECVLSCPAPDDPIPFVRGGDVSGSLHASETRRFDFDLRRFWGVKQTGDYQVKFAGKFPYIYETGKGTEFEMGALTFRIEDPPPTKPTTNAPAILPNQR